jgi:alkylation response protein AidB-like acyl-CoA dehydrogenase
MATYQSDLQDIFFNLFDVHKVHEMTDMYEENDLKDILREYDKFIGNEFFTCRESGDQEAVKLEKDGVKVPPSFHAPHKAFYENGWYGLGYPEEIEGIPAPEPISFAAASISTGANVSLSMYYGLTKGAMNVILKVGSEEQKKFYVPHIMSGEWGGTMCLTEPGAGSQI